MNEGSSGEIQEESVCRDVGSNQNSESVDINYANEYEGKWMIFS
jgi:hypothetical protein